MIDPDFDLQAYLERIAITDARQPPLALLGALCAAHPAAIPFENIDPLLARAPSLHVRDVQAKLVGARRGGYCFEHNALFRQALLALGFEVFALAARVVWMAPASLPLRPATHMLLMVELETQRYLVDAGFGGHLINAPVRFEPGLVQVSSASRLRIVEAGDVYALEAELPEGWAPLYRFTLTPQQPVDYEPLNWFTATHPASIFRHNLLMERLTANSRASLLNDRLTLRASGSPSSVQRLHTVADFERTLTEVFGLRLPVPAAELFERVPRGRDGIVMPPP